MTSMPHNCANHTRRTVQRLRILSLALVTALTCAAATTIVATDEEPDAQYNSQARESRLSYAIGLWGDLPYSPVQAEEGLPHLLADMNAQKLAFTVHNGDLKAGSNSLCDDALYEQSLDYFNSLRAPAMFTPGDNDWTDCDRAANGAYSSLERLDREREVFSAPHIPLAASGSVNRYRPIRCASG